MTILKSLLKTPLSLEQIPKWIPVTLLLVALLGFADATYLTAEHYSNSIPPCTTGGCETVLTSAYSEVAGIPVALAGGVYYFFIATLVFFYVDSKKEIFLRMALLSTVLGLLASIWFSFLQIFVIQAFCPYCAVSAVTSTTLFILACVVIRTQRHV